MGVSGRSYHRLHLTISQNCNLPMRKCTRLRSLGVLIALCTGFSALAKDNIPHPPTGQRQIHTEKVGLDFVENKGQWDSRARYAASVPGGTVFLTSDGFMYSYASQEDIRRAEELWHEQHKDASKEKIRNHAYKVTFAGSLPAPKVETEGKRNYYFNYFIGNDQSHWAGGVGAFGKVSQKNIYNGIDLAVYSQQNSMKYDFIVAPGADAGQIALSYEGVKPVLSKEGNLVIRTSVNEITEQAPYTYQMVGGQKKEVKSRYKLSGSTVGFEFPEGYDRSLPLVIDPVLVFATFSGGISLTGTGSGYYAYSSTYDAAGNMYASSGAYHAGWPVTVGAFQTTFAGNRDVSINKYNASGTTLIYSTYYGGAGQDFPQAMKVNAADELVLLGSTNSFNLPYTTGCHDNTLGGAADMFVAHFSQDGSSLIGATYVGGSGEEPRMFGFNANSNSFTDNNAGINSPLELDFDADGNIWVVGNTNSTDFPTELNPFYATNTVYKSICPGDSYTMGTETYFATGIYVDTFTTAGCDSIVTLHLTVKPFKYYTFNHSICAGDSYMFGGVARTTNGNYVDTFATSGCDSIVTLNLTVNPLITHAESVSICAGGSYAFGSALLSTPGVYTDTFATSGCDSIVTLTLSVNPYLRDTLHETICTGSRYLFGDLSITTPGTYIDTFKTFGGCDSIVTLFLNMGPRTTYTVQAGFCPGTSYPFGTEILTEPGTYIDTFTTPRCDSIVTLVLFRKPYVRNTVQASICVNGSYTFGSEILTTGGTYVDTFSATGCDSIVTLHLTVTPNILNSVSVSLCPGTTYQFGNQTISTSGLYIQTFPTATCDSVVTLTVTANPYITYYTNESMCPNGVYQFGDALLTGPGVYVDTFHTDGCDSIVTLNLTSDYNNNLNGGIDVVLYQLDPTCSDLMFSRYLGGSGDDSPTGLIFNKEGRLVLSGITNSNNYPTSPNAMNPNFIGGWDGFVSIINPATGSVIESTYLGTTAADHAVSVQVDDSNQVYVLGRTVGNYPVSPGVWNSNNNGDLFIDKLKPNLSASLLSTRVGNPQTSSRFIPSAFLVDICKNVYVAGFGATGGLPLTADAYQTNTAGFWFGVLTPNFNGLFYGSYFGVNGDHGHCGVSRMDPNGIVYHSICCAAVTYPGTTSASFAQTKQNVGQDIISFKFNFEATGVNSNFELTPGTNDTGCAPYTVTMVNTSSSATSYTWDFGDNTGIVTTANPTHTYTDSGTYRVVLHAYNPNTCITDDSTVMIIKVLRVVEPQISVRDTVLCSNQQSIELTVHIANPTDHNIIQWGPAAGLLTAGNQATVSVNPAANDAYYVIVKDTVPGICGFSASDTAHIDLAPRVLDILNNDTVVCEGTQIQIHGTGTPAYRYHWSPATGVSDTGILEPVITVNEANIYTITGSYVGCADTSISLNIGMHYMPHLEISPDKYVCQGTLVALESNVMPYRDDYIYSWTPAGNNLSNPAGPNTSFTADTNATYYLHVETPIGCADDDTVKIVVYPGGFGAITPDTGYCPGNEARLVASGGIAYSWSPEYGLSDTSIANPVANPQTTTEYTVLIRDQHDCVDTEKVRVQVYPMAMLELPETVRIYSGEQYHVEPGTNAAYFQWFPPSGLSNPNIADPLVSPSVRTRYFVTATTEHGCVVVDSMDVLVEETTLDMPNAFAPAGANKLFKPSRRGIAQLKEFSIFNRWGNKVYSSTNIEEGWDGTFNGKPQPTGVYVYVIEAVTDKGVPFSKKGNVTLLR